MTTLEYYFEHEWAEERERLRELESYFDPHTHADMEAVGIKPGWRCLEVGGGGGSIAEWLSWRVGPTGRVVVTDLSTRFIEPLRASNLEVRRHNIAEDSLEENTFDLIHARAVLEHVVERDLALDKMIRALRPGGWLVLESADFRSLLPMAPEHDELFRRVFGVLHELLEERGFDDEYGRRLGWELRKKSLEPVHIEGRLFEWGGPGILTAFYTSTFRKLGLAAAAQERASQQDLDAFFEMISAPEFRAWSHVTCAVRAQKPR